MVRSIAQEFHVYDEQMLTSRLFYLSDFAQEIWKSKEEAMKENRVYIGG